LHHAVSLLRLSEIEEAYEAAWEEWRTGDQWLWDSAAGDGLDDASR
jgi:antitoxin MazE9